MTWNQNAEEVTGYRIYYSQVTGVYSDYVEIASNSYALSSLPSTEGVTYYLVVRAYNAAGESENSNEIIYTAPDNTPPAQPQGLSANSQAGSLSWQANRETDLNAYRVYYGKSSGSYNPFIPVGKTTGYTFSNLEPGIQYYCAVSAVDQSGNESGYSSAVILTLPSGVGSSTVSSGSGPVLSWTPSSGVVTGYRVYYGTIPDSYPNRWDAGNTTQLALSVLPIEEGKTYYFVVRAYNDSGESVNSEVETWTTVSSVKDTEKPTILIKTPTTSATYNTTVSTINFSGTASDNEGVTQVAWNSSRGGNGLASGTTTWSISGVSLAEGNNILTITATDAAGNVGIRAVTVFYSIPVITPPPPLSANLSISNLKTASGKIYPVKTALANGSTCYIDRSYVYSNVPSFLLKSMYIQTANDDKLRTGSSFLSFDINTAATIYVAYEDRAPLPSWLSGFTNTGNKLWTKSLMKIFKKDYNAGRVTLGGNSNDLNHYTVMVVQKTLVVNLSISNLKAASGKIYPVKTALANGSICYIDRSYVYSNVPSFLLKSMYIQTANDDKLRTGSSFLSFDINTAATIYVAYEDRCPLPSWLSGFTNTGNKLWTKSLMKIFKKDYNAGRVSLGGNSNNLNHYTVIAVKK
ncbi:MAG: fibronectin type III domain-containing protein [Pseudomonadota bacterium]